MSDMNAGLLVPLIVLIFIFVALTTIFYIDKFVRRMKEKKSKDQKNDDNKSSID